jgi:lambda family phage portal protein
MAFGGYYQTGQGRERRYVPAVAADSRATLTAATRRTILGLARYLHANSGAVRGAVADLTRYSVGVGIIPQSQAKPEIAEAYENFWREWSKIADATGRRTFEQIQQLASLRMDVDGDVGLVLRQTESGYPQVQLVEGHAIGSDVDEKGWQDGVKVSPDGRPLAFRVNGEGDEFTNIGARDFILLAETERVGQQRGVSSLAHALDHLRDLEDILGYEKVGVKMGAAIGVAITTEGGTVDEGAAYIEGGAAAAITGSPLETFEAGMVPRLRIGEKIESFASNRPNPSFNGFIEHLLRDVSVGLGLPFEFIWNAEKVGGATQRFVLAKAQRRFEQRQSYLISAFLNRVWGWVIASAIKRGDLPKSADWWRVRWQCPAKITVDVGREASANRDDIKMGLRTLQEDAGERGVDWLELRDQAERETADLITRAQRVSKETGVDFQTVLYFMQGRAPNQPVTPEPTEAK